MSLKFKNIAVVGLTSAFIAGFSAFGIVSPDKDISVTERRPLTKMPVLSGESVLSGKYMSDFENHALDQFPLREKFRSLKAVTAMYGMGKTDNNGIYFSDGYASKLDYPLNEDSLRYAAERIRYIYDKYLADSNCYVYFSIIPDKNFFLADKEKVPHADYYATSEYMTEKLDFAQYIDIFPTLRIENYYKTDTHWRQETLSETASLLMESMYSPYSFDSELKLLDNPFYGVYYGQSALPLDSEQLWYMDSEAIQNCTVYDYQSGKNISVYDMEKAYSADPYEMFLSGSVSLLTIENPSAKTDKELIIFRDSFGSSIAPHFVESYRKITLIDTRYIYPDMLGKFIELKNSDVLFLYSTLVLNNSNTLK